MPAASRVMACYQSVTLATGKANSLRLLFNENIKKLCLYDKWNHEWITPVWVELEHSEYGYIRYIYFNGEWFYAIAL